jgi:hypothetical protein
MTAFAALLVVGGILTLIPGVPSTDAAPSAPRAAEPKVGADVEPPRVEAPSVVHATEPVLEQDLSQDGESVPPPRNP